MNKFKPAPDDIRFGGDYPPDKEGVLPQNDIWWPIAFEGGRFMQRVNGYQFYQLSAAIHPLTSLQTDRTIQQVLFPLYNAREWVNYFLQGHVVPLRVSKPKAQRLVSAINKLLPPDFPQTPPQNPEEKVGFRAATIIQEAKDFETVLAAELQDVDTYFISKKGIYVTSDLIDAADMALDESVRKGIVPEATKDFKESGKCLAFDLATASGFHAMRATEAVLRQYHALIMKLPAGSKKVEMAVCINELRAAGADSKTLGVLDQIRDLHRNTLMHPDVFLTVPEALRLFDIAKSAISAMADQIALIPAAPVTPATP